MLVIRLNRVGKRNKAQFRIVVQEHSVAPGGRHVEVVGSYDPHLKKTVLKEDRIQYWISKGAQPSVTAHNLLVSNGVLKGEKIAVKMRKKAKKGEEEGKEGENKEEAKPAEESKEEAKKEESKPEEKVEDKKEEEKPAEEPKKEAASADAAASQGKKEEAPKAEEEK